MARSAARVLDEYLVSGAQRGDGRAYELLVRRWQKKLVGHAWQLTGDVELAQEAAQQGWVEIVRGLDRLRDARAFPAWAFRIVSRACARQIGSAIDRRLVAETLDEQPRSQLDPADGPWEVDRLRAAIRALPAEQRAAIALFHFEEMSVAEVAVALEVPAGTVKTRLMHARRKLRAAVEGEE